jgi:hypothetical protein
VKEQLFKFVTNSSEILIDFHYEDKLLQIVEILNSQEGISESEVIRKGDSNFGSRGIASTDRLNVFKESLKSSFVNTFGNSLTQNLTDAKLDNNLMKPAHDISDNFEKNSKNGVQNCYKLKIPNTIPNHNLLHDGDRKPSLGCDARSFEGGFAKAKFNLKGEMDKDLSFTKGDIIEIHARNPNGWWVGKNLRTGLSGYFPTTFIEVIE